MNHNKLIIENIIANNLINLNKLHQSLHLFVSLAPFHQLTIKKYQELQSLNTKINSHIK